MTAAEIHSYLELTENLRTVQRDLQHLQKAGFPLYEEGHRWKLLDQGIQSYPLTYTQILALLLTEELLRPFEASDIAAALTDLREVIAASVRPEVNEYVAQATRYLATISAPVRLPPDNEIVEIIEDAIHKEQQLDLSYWSPKSGYAERRVDPYCLWFANGRLYLIAWCHLRKAFRTFHVGRIRSATLLDEVFERDATFDPRAFAGDGFGVWRGEEREVVLVFDRDVAHIPTERLLHPTQRCHANSNGSVRVSFRTKALPELAGWIAGFGGLVQAWAPEDLVRMVHDIHRSGLARYENALSAVVSGAS